MQTYFLDYVFTEIMKNVVVRHAHNRIFSAIYIFQQMSNFPQWFHGIMVACSPPKLAIRVRVRAMPKKCKFIFLISKED